MPLQCEAREGKKVSASRVKCPSSLPDFDQTYTFCGAWREIVTCDVWVTPIQCLARCGRKICFGFKRKVPFFTAWFRKILHRLWLMGKEWHVKILSHPVAIRGATRTKNCFALRSKVTMTTEDWKKGTGPPPVVKGLVWFTDGSRMRDGRTGAGVYGQSEGRRLSISLGKYVTDFRAEICAILACVYELQNKARSEKYISICSDSQAALQALQAVKTTSSLVQQCQRALDDISPYHSAGLFWVPGHSGIGGNEIADELAKEGTAHHFVGPQPAVGVSRQCIRGEIQCWSDRQHLVRWWGLVGTVVQAQELISGPNIAARTELVSFNRAQSRVVIGLLAGHNTLRRHLHIMGLLDSPVCRKCGARQETSAHVLCECEALATLRHIHLGSFSLDPENVRDLSLRAIWNFYSRTGLS
jgi:ribonuclease HI